MRYTRESVIQQYRNNPDIQFIFFWGHTVTPGKLTKACFSQWYPCEFTVDGITYHTTEQYMMAQKAHLFQDAEICAKIMAAGDPRDYKELGRQVRGFDAKLWDANKFQIVVQGNVAKFSQNLDLKAFLLGTGESILVEASPFDDIWGVKIALSDEKIRNPENWQGRNLLGFALMEARDILRAQ